MTIAGLSDRGMIREINEDSFAVRTYADGYQLAIVADGMGGHQAGEIASSMAVQTVLKKMDETIKDGTLDLQEGLYEAVELANREVFDFSRGYVSMYGMGTTIVVALVDDSRIRYAHVGDSRLYLLHNQQLQQLTEDHSHVQNLMNQGIITAEEARTHSKRNIILRAIGTDEDVEIDLNECTWQPGDSLLLCSDGLTNMVRDERIAEIIGMHVTVEEKLAQLIAEANEAGGDDNITAVIIQHEVKQSFEGSDAN